MKALTALLDLVPSWLWLVIAGAFAATSCVEHNTITQLRLDIEVKDKAVAEKEAARAKAALAAEQAQRALGAMRQRTLDEVANEVDAERKKTAAAVARGAARERVWHNAVAALSGPNNASGSPKTAAELARATAALGWVYESCRRQRRSGAEQAEGLATQVRGLQKAYSALLPETSTGLRPPSSGPLPPPTGGSQTGSPMPGSPEALGSGLPAAKSPSAGGP